MCYNSAMNTKKLLTITVTAVLMLAFIFAGSLTAQGKVMEKAMEKAKKNYEMAKKNFDRDPSEENTIWLGRRTAYLGKYNDAIAIYTDGLKKFPKSYKLYRHRGHRYISVRQFTKAIADFNQAAKLINGAALEVEPDGLPNAANIPLSNTQFNIFYHLGLAHYLTGDFQQAAAAYHQCLKWCKNDDSTVATTHWLYMTYRRMGKKAEAQKALAPIKKDMKIIEDFSYHNLTLLYKGLISTENALIGKDGRTLEFSRLDASMAYGVANRYLYNGNKAKAVELFKQMMKSSVKAAFGYIAAEIDLTRI